ncbi:hypothetical protein DTO271D3_6924 [Paecilomyces variotii]|nr:hypothetical protein DTO032I3_1174 [Paecilomyces variotii]KAJ9245145.1 hypothetical protein DTO169E5_1012 [Paecilomyces variotii]KAJ9277822.1 hypothetical protein DTO021D3_5405 [Paecilomyces variotii]KAJ9312849.1 hypothetical protein DTO271D3_6924 [Paecilomyces variotii]KAJ9326241.1 hypothetical protein DTO027B3_2888 [Paecilomyces variotii]
MVKPLTFKGDKPKKRKHRTDDTDPTQRRIKSDPSSSSALTTTTGSAGPAEDENAEDTSWVSADVPTDISGPVIIVLPSSKPSCVACDANGKVFVSELENLIEGDPATAEPHDVRQVWVATKVAGSEGVSFKGHHGRYLSCDKYGILSATSAAISPFESFRILPAPDTPGLFSFQTVGGDSETFLSVKEDEEGTSRKGSSSKVEVRGDAKTLGFETSFRVRMQARFKPRVKASKESKAREKISRRELEEAVGRRLEDHEVKRLKRARREGNFHEEVLDVRRLDLGPVLLSPWADELRRAAALSKTAT